MTANRSGCRSCSTRRAALRTASWRSAAPSRKETRLRIVWACADYPCRPHTPSRMTREDTGYRKAGQMSEELGAGQLSDEQRSEEHTSELQSRENLVCRLL